MPRYVGSAELLSTSANERVPQRAGLPVAVMVYVKLDGLTGFVCRALVMTVGEMRVMRGGFMAACLMMRCCFAVMVGSVLEMLGGAPMVLCGLLRHRSTS
jgi:hypothetical protein